MLKELFVLFYRLWIVGFLALLVGFSLILLYYPFHSWMFADKWRWPSFEYAMRWYAACVPFSLIMALGVTFNYWIEIRKKDKKPD